MEPTLPTPSTVEGSALAPNAQPSPSLQAPEAAPVAPEKVGEQMPLASVQPLQPVAPVQDDTQVMQSVVAPTPSATPADDNPQIADDVDVIEKEWVDKAKKIVSATRDDPHMQEKEVSKLQADYLLKRYNKQTKLGG